MLLGKRIPEDIQDLVLAYKRHRKAAKLAEAKAAIAARSATRALVELGWSHADIARVFNVVKQTVQKWLGIGL